jgi:probable phosphoglycerate mutase
MRALLLIRHGALVGDAERRFVGATDLPMSEAGKAQVRDLAARLAARAPFDAVYCSDLARSRRAAELLAAGRAIPIHVEPALREIDLGAWEGLTRGEIAESLPDEYARRGADIANFRPPGGESFADLAARVTPCWRRLFAESESGVVAVAGHAGVNRVILCDVLGMPLANLFRIAQRPGCVNVIEQGRGGPVVRLLDGGSL